MRALILSIFYFIARYIYPESFETRTDHYFSSTIDEDDDDGETVFYRCEGQHMVGYEDGEVIFDFNCGQWWFTDCMEPCPYPQVDVEACCGLKFDPYGPTDDIDECIIFGEPHVQLYGKRVVTCDLFNETVVVNNEVFTISVTVGYGINWPVRKMTKLIAIEVMFKENGKIFVYSIENPDSTIKFTREESETFKIGAGVVVVTPENITISEGTRIKVQDLMCHLNLDVWGHLRGDGVCSAGCTERNIHHIVRRDFPDFPVCDSLEGDLKDTCNFDVFVTNMPVFANASHFVVEMNEEFKDRKKPIHILSIVKMVLIIAIPLVVVCCICCCLIIFICCLCCVCSGVCCFNGSNRKQRETFSYHRFNIQDGEIQQNLNRPLLNK